MKLPAKLEIRQDGHTNAMLMALAGEGLAIPAAAQAAAHGEANWQQQVSTIQKANRALKTAKLMHKVTALSKKHQEREAAAKVIQQKAAVSAATAPAVAPKGGKKSAKPKASVAAAASASSASAAVTAAESTAMVQDSVQDGDEKEALLMPAATAAVDENAAASGDSKSASASASETAAHPNADSMVEDSATLSDDRTADTSKKASTSSSSSKASSAVGSWGEEDAADGVGGSAISVRKAGVGVSSLSSSSTMAGDIASNGTHGRKTPASAASSPAPVAGKVIKGAGPTGAVRSGLTPASLAARFFNSAHGLVSGKAAAAAAVAEPPLNGNGAATTAATVGGREECSLSMTTDGLP